jgi:hypothetical protein
MFPRVIRELHFQNWCNKIIIFNDTDFITQKLAIIRFVRDGIFPFLKSYGYILHPSYSTVYNEIASALFLNKYKFEERNLDYHEYDYGHWQYIVTTEDWMNFFEFWSTQYRILDSPQVQAGIINYIWDQINLPNSPSSHKLDEFLYDTDEDDDTAVANKNVDPYLLDAEATANYHY